MEPNILNYRVIKKQAKNLLKVNRRRLTILNIPLAILTVMLYVGIYFMALQLSQNFTTNQLTNMINTGEISGLTGKSSVLIVGMNLFIAMVVTGVQYSILDWLRKDGDKEINHPIADAFKVFGPDYFFQVIGIWIITDFLLQIGLSLFVIPGIFIQVALSQQYLIFKDWNNSDKKIGIIRSMTGSYRIMKYHKWNYFILELSFLGWDILNIFTFGIISFWLFPYKNLALTLFYNNLLDHFKKE